MVAMCECGASGNDYLHLLTTASPARTYELRVDLADFDDETLYAEYSHFAIASAAENYRMDLGVYSGNAGLLLPSPRYIGGTGYCCRSISLFIYLYLSLFLC